MCGRGGRGEFQEAEVRRSNLLAVLLFSETLFCLYYQYIIPSNPETFVSASGYLAMVMVIPSADTNQAEAGPA